MTTISGRNARDNQTHSTYEKILYTGNRSYQCEYCCARNDRALCMALPNCIDRTSNERFIFKPIGVGDLAAQAPSFREGRMSISLLGF